MRRTHLDSQTQGVKDDQDKHDIFEASGVDHIPELVLVGVFGNVATQGASFQSVFHTLTLQRGQEQKQTNDIYQS